VLKALRQNTAYLQREVAQRLGLKFAPKLKFLADESFDEAERIERLLNDPKVARDPGRSGRRLGSRSSGLLRHGAPRR
jgi:ribosome-binding factor A